MWARISKCQSGGKETSINRLSNIYSIIDRQAVSFLKRKNNKKWLLCSSSMYVWGMNTVFYEFIVINSWVTSGTCTLVETQKANGVLLTAIHGPANVWKNVRGRKGEREVKWKEINGWRGLFANFANLAVICPTHYFSLSVFVVHWNHT